MLVDLVADGYQGFLQDFTFWGGGELKDFGGGGGSLGVGGSGWSLPPKTGLQETLDIYFLSCWPKQCGKSKHLGSSSSNVSYHL